MFLDVYGIHGIELPLFTKRIISGLQTSQPGFKYDDVLLRKCNCETQLGHKYVKDVGAEEYDISAVCQRFT